jgi:hypothetical protein
VNQKRASSLTRGKSVRESKPKPPLQVIGYFLDEVHRMKRYLEFSEMLLNEEHARYVRSLRSEDEHETERYAHRRDLSADFTDLFPQYHRRSAMLVFFGMFEENLNHLCCSLKESRSLPLGPSDLADRGIDRSRIYLTKVAGWTFDATRNWTNLKKIQKIRNLVAHSSGYLAESSLGEIKPIVDNNAYLSIETGARKRIILEVGYLKYVLNNVESYWRTLEKICPR